MKKIIVVIGVVVACFVFLKYSKNKTQLPESITNLEPEKMSEERARSIAETGECAIEGLMKDMAFYNENSKTWWIDMDAEKPGCNPACVISEDETSEINWRCTGLISD